MGFWAEERPITTNPEPVHDPCATSGSHWNGSHRAERYNSGDVLRYARIAVPKIESPLAVDLNHDGVTNFSFYNASGTCEKRKHVRRKEGCSFAYMDLIPAQAGNAVGSSQSFDGAQCVPELRAGHVIGAGKKFKSNYLDMFQIERISYTEAVNCPWNSKGNTGGFTALESTIVGETHYGWAHVV